MQNQYIGSSYPRISSRKALNIASNEQNIRLKIRLMELFKYKNRETIRRMLSYAHHISDSKLEKTVINSINEKYPNKRFHNGIITRKAQPNIHLNSNLGHFVLSLIDSGISENLNYIADSFQKLTNKTHMPIKRFSDKKDGKHTIYVLGKDKNYDFKDKKLNKSSRRAKWHNGFLQKLVDDYCWINPRTGQHCCPYCHKPFSAQKLAYVDHRIESVILKEHHIPDNKKEIGKYFQPICAKCNDIKRHMCNSKSYKKFADDCINKRNGLTMEDLRQDYSVNPLNCNTDVSGLYKKITGKEFKPQKYNQNIAKIKFHERRIKFNQKRIKALKQNNKKMNKNNNYNVKNKIRQNNTQPKDYIITCNKKFHSLQQHKHKKRTDYEIIESLENDVNNDKSRRMRVKKIRSHYNKYVHRVNKPKAHNLESHPTNIKSAKKLRYNKNMRGIQL